MYDSFGLAEDLLREAYHVLEVGFWSSGSDGNIVCTQRTADTEAGLSHHPHVILNQARVNGLLIDAMRVWNGQEIDYGHIIRSVQVDSQAAEHPESYPVTVTTEKNGQEEVFVGRYALVSIPWFRSRVIF